MGLGINRYGALQGFGLGFVNANENDSQLNGVCCNSLGGCGITFRVSSLGFYLPLSVSLPLSISRKAKVDRGLMVSLRILQGLNLIPLFVFPSLPFNDQWLGVFFSFLFT
jgi:exosortase/archaeosortase